jgi:hypothetical protein
MSRNHLPDRNSCRGRRCVDASVDARDRKPRSGRCAESAPSDSDANGPCPAATRHAAARSAARPPRQPRRARLAKSIVRAAFRRGESVVRIRPSPSTTVDDAGRGSVYTKCGKREKSVRGVGELSFNPTGAHRGRRRWGPRCSPRRIAKIRSRFAPTVDETRTLTRASFAD